MKVELGKKVTRIGSSKDYTTGRRGTIIEIAEIDPRVRVHWTSEANGTPINIRTWVNLKFLINTELVSESSSEEI